MAHIITVTHSVNDIDVHVIGFHDSQTDLFIDFPIRTISSIDELIGLANFYLSINKINATMIDIDISGCIKFEVNDEN